MSADRTDGPDRPDGLVRPDYVVQLAREAGADQVIIAEGSAQYREGDVNRDRFCTPAAFRVAGYDADGDMVDDVTGAPLVDLDVAARGPHPAVLFGEGNQQAS